MNEKEAFLSTFDPMPEETRLPADILSAYAPDSCLANKDGRFVWRMRRRSDGALFVLKAAPAEHQDLLEEFRILTRLAPLLPGQVPAPADYLQDGGMEYLIRAYLPGITLDQYQEQVDGQKMCVRLGQKICALLEKLHSQQPPVIHRDIKPENIVILPDGEIALIDFSIARQYKEGRDTDTRHMGTRTTAAPEQYGYAQTDCRTDLYALGMTLIWLLTGSYGTEALKDISDPSLRQTLKKAVSFAPEDRYQSAAAFSAALSGPAPRRMRGWFVAAALLFIVLIGAAAGREQDAGALFPADGVLKAGTYILDDHVELTTDLTVNSGEVDLYLNGYNLNGTGRGSVITVTGGTLNIYDRPETSGDHGAAGSIKGGGGADDQSGGGVTVSGGTLNLFGGIITGNHAVNGGGVFVGDGGTLTLNGGVLDNNTADTAGGGVYVTQGGAFVFEHGTLFGNKSDGSGGGVFVCDGTLTMRGGTMEGNFAQGGDGGAVCIAENGSFTMTGGTVTINEASGHGGGVYQGGTLRVAGMPEIINNVDNSVYLPAGRVIVNGVDGTYLDYREPSPVSGWFHIGVLTEKLPENKGDHVPMVQGGDPRADWFYNGESGYTPEEHDGSIVLSRTPLP